MSSNVGRVLAATLTSAALLAGLAGCGGSGGDGGDGAPAVADTELTIKEGANGGTMTLLSSADVDSLDPGLADYNLGLMVLQATQRMLYSVEPDDPTKVVPDLADGMPDVSADLKTITVKLKPGIRFSPPVDREVTSHDVKYAFERAFSKQVPSYYAGTYFANIVGVPDPPNAGNRQDIAGITTPDDRTIVFKLSKPLAGQVAQVLVKGITAPVPEEYASEFDAQNPSTYAQHVVSTGPYMVDRDASGKITGWKPGRELRLVRNPNWDPETDFRPAYLDAITISEGNTDKAVATRRTLDGQGFVCCDSGTPPVEQLRTALEEKRSQVALFPARVTRWVALNTTVAPLDNINVRKALMAGVDRSALRLPWGGPLAGEVATGYIPAGLAGYEEAGGLRQGADLDFNANPDGDAEVAKKYMLAAGAEGVPVDASGRYTGDEEIVAVAANSAPDNKVAETFQAQAEKLGFKVSLRLVPREVVYTNFCSRPAKKVAICFVGFGPDSPDAYSMLVVPFDGRAIREEGNLNISQLDDPKINAAMDEAAALVEEKPRLDAWAEVNEMILAQAPAIPYLSANQALVSSSDVVLVPSGYSTLPDLAFTSIRK